MYGTFNMGVGTVVVLTEADAQKALALLPDAYLVGEITENAEKIQLI